MPTPSFDEREMQLMLVALRYWRMHRAEGAIRRSDPHLGPEFVDILIGKLTSALPPTELDSRQRGLFPADQPSSTPATVNDSPLPSDRKPGPRR